MYLNDQEDNPYHLYSETIMILFNIILLDIIDQIKFDL